MRLVLGLACVAGVIFGLGGSPAAAQPLTTVRIASGLSLPLYVTHAPNDYDRIFILEQRSGSTGRIRIFDFATNTLLPTPFLSITGLSTGFEQGLLGLAFHPDYQNNGYFYVYYTVSGGASVIARYQRATTVTANAASNSLVLTFSQPFNNHNGGWIGFGPDGYLYVASGDGGSANDPGNRAQDITSQLLGKILRIDVDGPDNIVGNADDDEYPADATRNYALPPTNPFVGVTGDDEIWAYGLRNPWRCSFDRATGDFYIGDVGQDAQEELNFQPAGAAGGRNYGWRCMEGTACTGLTGCTCNAPALTMPFHTFPHSGTSHCSVTGGYVYRGCTLPALQGAYFFADYCSNQIWSLRYNGSVVSDFQNRTAELAPGGGLSIASITSFGEDAYGELYICDQAGEVFKILPAGGITDCNANGVSDTCDLVRFPVLDCNGDGLLDSCVPPPPPQISQQPQSVEACIGETVQFSVTASGSGTLSYQWNKGGAPIGGASNSTLSVGPITLADAGSYSCTVTDACGNVVSQTATLTVLSPPSINGHPQSVSVCDGASVVLSVSATGDALAYQWRKGGSAMPGESGTTLVLTPANYGDNGTYDVVVTNACGTVVSMSAIVDVYLRSDANCDGAVNNFDIDFFSAGVLDPTSPTAPAAYLALGGTQACWDQRLCWGDGNFDLMFNNFDIDPFVACVVAPPPPGFSCP
ncbi:MAG: PQQ-dependent sugar dehydrogenase [Planctomycetia bacterium]|nr:MAG: PQQ-dependent sugar dehydrogenase [Planctomycetia bacterium]